MNKLIFLALICLALSACSGGDKTFIVPPTSEEGKAVLRQFREEMRTAGIEDATVTLDDGATGKLHFTDQARWVLQSSGEEIEVHLYSPSGTVRDLTVRRAN